MGFAEAPGEGRLKREKEGGSKQIQHLRALGLGGWELDGTIEGDECA